MRLIASFLLALPALAQALNSPDGQLQVDVSVNAEQQLVYSVQRAGQPVLLASRLGLVLEQGDFANGLKLVATSPVKAHREQYTLAAGKKSRVDYRANEQHFTVANAQGQKLVLTLRASNDGLALRYTVDGPGRKTFKDELTSFAFAPDARAWLQPMAAAKSGYKRVNPSYEEHYQMGIAVGTPSPMPAGWIFPALFRASSNWVALTEAGMDGRFHASRLQADSTGGIYRIGLPDPSEVFTGGHLLADVDGPLI
jgi:alpha-glucosidase